MFPTCQFQWLKNYASKLCTKKYVLNYCTVTENVVNCEFKFLIFFLFVMTFPHSLWLVCIFQGSKNFEYSVGWTDLCILDLIYFVCISYHTRVDSPPPPAPVAEMSVENVNIFMCTFTRWRKFEIFWDSFTEYFSKSLTTLYLSFHIHFSCSLYTEKL